MLKKDVTYTDFDDMERTDTLYFNLSKSTILDNFELQDELEEVERMIRGNGEARTLSRADNRMILELVKKVMRLSYGERSVDGKRFIQTPQVWEEFTQTAAYDEFLLSLFTDPEEAYAFIVGIMPKDLKNSKEVAAAIPQTAAEAKDEDQPAWVRENRDPTPAELREMTPEQLHEAFARKTSQR